jgi:SAM-dependent methyltransferase
VRERRLEARQPHDYRDYLRIQLRRSLSKRWNDPGVGARVLIDEIARRAPDHDVSVLCVGCRNGLELDEFHARGFHDVVGIDLFSQRDDIRVMDMHDMTFASDSFGVVYASHVLEHAYDVATVVGEIVRVAKQDALVAVEVPVRHRGSDADRAVFEGLGELRELLRPHIHEELRAEEQPPRSALNAQGSDVARIVFRLRKEEGRTARPHMLTEP